MESEKALLSQESSLEPCCSTDNQIMEKTCPRCGKAFVCVHSVDCWCVTVHLTEKAKAKLKSMYSDCLCKTCLGEIDAENEV